MVWRQVLIGVSVLLATTVDAIPIDNGVEGDPEVQCGGTSIGVAFNTQNNFEGHVYVLNHFNDEKCRAAGDNRKQGAIDVPFDSCGIKRERSVEPRGIFISTTVVIKFHPTFVTKIDRAVSIRCFYMEADKTVSQELEVSALTTGVPLTITVPMPVCRYEILENDENGKPIRFAIIGQQVFHKWTCDSETVNTFCMVVYGCVVNDGANDTIQLLDDQGCALDKHILGNLEYPTDLMAGKEAHVFKYADRNNLYFNCQIRITIKEPGQECARPQCPTLRKKRFVSPRSKRQAALDDLVQDVSIQHPIMVGDVDMTEKDYEELSQQNGQVGPTSPSLPKQKYTRTKLSADFCISPAGFMVMVFVSTIIFVASVILGARIFMY